MGRDTRGRFTPKWTFKRIFIAVFSTGLASVLIYYAVPMGIDAYEKTIPQIDTVQEIVNEVADRVLDPIDTYVSDRVSQEKEDAIRDKRLIEEAIEAEREYITKMIEATKVNADLKEAKKNMDAHFQVINNYNLADDYIAFAGTSTIAEITENE